MKLAAAGAVIATLAIGIALVLYGVSGGEDTSASMAAAAPTPAKKSPVSKRQIVFLEGEFDGVKFERPEAEWKIVLSAEEYHILRKEGTEYPYTGELNKTKAAGTYHCAACGLQLFRSETKFDSGTGWPSFYQPAFKKNVAEKEDRSIASEVRTEVECARCGSHLGHVFDDGPEPTGLRYCINSLSLRFKAAK